MEQKLQRLGNKGRRLSTIHDYRGKIESELWSICDSIVKLLDSKLSRSASDGDSKVFYMKMKGKYYSRCRWRLFGGRWRSIGVLSSLFSSSSSFTGGRSEELPSIRGEVSMNTMKREWLKGMLGMHQPPTPPPCNYDVGPSGLLKTSVCISILKIVFVGF
ncbi:hypothetical protein L1987_02861 [Smallanthus sonchifolius]|uniref:Uncharacterized protein n=1 Tax=Smallanthus sonchifolius TaxID=185202 RepID=A0ACB9K8W4_9ASTR|nr:hypothetical protein L1987_02861 [Smallanthus sonchifolius]